MNKRFVFFAMYGVGAVMLWILADHLANTFPNQANYSVGSNRGIVAASGIVYAGSVICGILAILSLLGRAPWIPNDWPR